jgi:hypothetical protein
MAVRVSNELLVDSTIFTMGIKQKGNMNSAAIIYSIKVLSDSNLCGF